MFHAFRTSLQGAVTDRLVLLVNHVLAAEPVAGQRLSSHSGRRLKVQFEGWPSLLPPVPDLALRVTPAGLLEWCDVETGAEPDLRLRLDASNPLLSVAQWASGERPRVDVQGDAQFAADLSWLMDNLRWDVQDDLARLIGQAPAHELTRIGRRLAAGLRDALGALSGRRPGAGEPGRAAR